LMDIEPWRCMLQNQKRTDVFESSPAVKSTIAG
jgi:hypothetical protein